MAHTHYQTTQITLNDDDGLPRHFVLANDAHGAEGKCEVRVLDENDGMVGRILFHIDTGGHIGVTVQGDPGNISLD